MPEPARWGVDAGYHDAQGCWRDAPAATVEAILAAMGAGCEGAGARPSPIVTVRLDHPLPPVGPGVVALEHGGAVPVGGPLPPELPTGYHRLVPDDGTPVDLVVSPGRCPRPSRRTWGLAAQLYAARSTASWGIGDLADLRRLSELSVGLGAGMVLCNPLHAAAPGPHPEPSPYFATSRCFASPLYLCVEDVPGSSELDGLEDLAAAGRALNAGRRIDRDRVWALKSAALEALYRRCGQDQAFESYRSARAPALEGFATFCALAERHGLPWQAWPGELRHPDATAVRAFASGAGADRVRYHAWLQWQLDCQLEAATATPAGLLADLAIGVDAGGADAWLWQETFALGMRVGAPPDEFNTQGQDWGLPPWDPWRLRSAGYRPFVETIRAGLRHAGGLRFDHVMGLFRLYWIPTGAAATDGTYVRYPHWDLLNILALEAERAGAYVVGEDLGTVEDHVREELAEREVLSYRLLWFEPEMPPAWPERALGAVTTHDLPTVAGVWTGADLVAQRRLGLAPDEEGFAALRRRLAACSGADDSTPPAEVVAGAYAALAGAACDVLAVTLDDMAVVDERPNMPGTTDEWPNWRLALPTSLEDLADSPLLRRVAERMSTAGPAA